MATFWNVAPLTYVTLRRYKSKKVNLRALVSTKLHTSSLPKNGSWSLSFLLQLKLLLCGGFYWVVSSPPTLLPQTDVPSVQCSAAIFREGLEGYTTGIILEVVSIFNDFADKTLFLFLPRALITGAGSQ